MNLLPEKQKSLFNETGDGHIVRVYLLLIVFKDRCTPVNMHIINVQEN